MEIINIYTLLLYVMTSIVCPLNTGVTFRVLLELGSTSCLITPKLPMKRVDSVQIASLQEGCRVMQTIYNKGNNNRRSRFSRSICVDHHHTLFTINYVLQVEVTLLFDGAADSHGLRAARDVPGPTTGTFCLRRVLDVLAVTEGRRGMLLPLPRPLTSRKRQRERYGSETGSTLTASSWEAASAARMVAGTCEPEAELSSPASAASTPATTAATPAVPKGAGASATVCDRERECSRERERQMMLTAAPSPPASLSSSLLSRGQLR